MPSLYNHSRALLLPMLYDGMVKSNYSACSRDAKSEYELKMSLKCSLKFSDVKRFFQCSQSENAVIKYLPILNSGGGAKDTSQFFNNNKYHIATLKLLSYDNIRGAWFMHVSGLRCEDLISGRAYLLY